MTKARDLAGAANSAVNSTEIGYLDGVTSSVQTQLDAKIAKSLVDAKGDLVAATAADTVDRLAVGSNGETLVADSSATTGLRWQANQAAGRNTCINGGMDIWQRGTSFVPTNGATTLGPDRWVMYRNGGTGSTVSRQTSGLTNFLYSCRVQRDSGNTSTNAIFIWQNWESQSTYQLAGKTIVISYYARAGANYSPTSSLLGVQLFTGTGVDENIWTGYTGQAQPLDATQAITTTWTRYTQVLTLNSNVTEMCLRFLMTPTGTASTNDWFEVTGIQVELGNVPTTFTRAGGTLAGELAACQRYYYRANATGGYSRFGLGQATGASQVYFVVPFPVVMRVRPTALEQSGTASHYAAVNATASSTLTGTSVPTFDSANTQTASVGLVVSSGLVAGNASQCIDNNTSSAYLGWSAEL